MNITYKLYCTTTLCQEENWDGHLQLSIQVDVLPAGQFRVETCTHLQQAGDAAIDGYGYTPGRRFGDAAQNLQQRAFPGAVAADDAHGLSAADLKTHILERPHFFQRVALDDGLPLEIGGHDAASCPPISSEGSGILHQHVAQSQIGNTFGLVADDVFFTEVFSFDDDGGHRGQLKGKGE
jgi:hypothetical protein